MIYTVTLNPSIDFIVRVDGLKIGHLNRMKEDFKVPGGKGINVSRMLKRLESSSTALGFLGGFTGNFISNWLEKEEIRTSFTVVQSDTRINIKLKSETETEINGLGPIISNEEIDELKRVLSLVGKGDIVVLSGSIPASLREGFYQELIEIVRKKGADFVIDTTGDELKNALREKPLLIKPNNHELAELYQTQFHSIEDILPYGKKLLAEGAQNVLISMAGDGALLFTKDGAYQSNVLVRPLKNSVGAGDSMIAGFIGSYSKKQDPIEAFKWGVACGSATAFSDDLASRALIDELLPEVEITKIDSFSGGLS
ncbi:MAG: 1-phosphofructokinase [Enterococcus lacertideformus]|uniref:Tagatose-6-phosphate kinase n=1 Tax=Enterococcus lacertideformus TaxID=2771493 RepID=A0A931B0H7_9ENTE|nr:1-phosphofructokinase [Enterococcus lacertideformus]